MEVSMRRRRLLLVVGAATLLAVAGYGLLRWLTAPTPGVTWENFRRLREGMTFQEVEALLGKPHKTDLIDGFTSLHYWGQWQSEEVGICLGFFPQRLSHGTAFPPDVFMKLDKVKLDKVKKAGKDAFLGWFEVMHRQTTVRAELTIDLRELEAEWRSLVKQGEGLHPAEESLLARIRRWLHR
jgi:hypothetical protein